MTHDDIENTRVDPAPEQAAVKRKGAPPGARHNVRSGAATGGVARPGGAAQNSGGALWRNEQEGAGTELTGE